MYKPTRREVVLSATGAAVLGLSGPLRFITSAAADAVRDKGYFSYKIGDAECISLYDGIWQKKHDAGFIKNATVEETKAALKKGGLSEDFIPIEFSQTVIKSGGKTILIDAGTGGQLAPSAGKMMANMKAAGVDAGSVDTILISHFHPDHIFGLMAKGTNEQIFPKAEIIVPEVEYKFWTEPGLIAKLPERRKGLAKRIQATFPNWKNITQVSGEKEVAPGVRALPTYGHTPGHTAFHLSSGSDQLIVGGDIANVPALFVANPDWHLVFDADAAQAQKSRQDLFARAVADNAVIAGYHFGFPNAGKISKDGKGYVFEAMG